MPRDAMVRGVLVALFATPVLVGVVGVVLFHARALRAEPVGLYSEQSTVVDGVTVRRVRDRSNGVICYVGSTPGFSNVWGQQPAISCVQGVR
jgi:hypothetical protein